MSLGALGQSFPAELVFRELVRHPNQSIAALMTAVNLDRRGIEAALIELSDSGLVIGNPGDLDQVRVRRPGAALADLVERRTLALTESLREIAETHTEIIALDELASRPAPLESPGNLAMAEVLRDPGAIADRMDHLAYHSRTSLDSITPDPPRTPEQLANGPSVLRSLHRGLQVRWVVQPEKLGDTANRLHVMDEMRAGAFVRVTTEPVERLIIVDGSVAMVPLDRGDPQAGALVVHHPSLIAELQRAFDRTWSGAMLLELHDSGGLRTPAALDLDADDRAVLKALASFPTDDLAARSIAISVRHFRRRAARVSAALGAQNRFHAGVLADRYGLIDGQ